MRHRLDHTQYRCDDPQGGQRIGHALHDVGWVQFLNQGLPQFARHDVLDLVGVVGVHPDHPQVVADDRAGVMVGQDLGELLEGRAVRRRLDMRLQRHRPLAAGQAHQEEQQTEQFDVIRFPERSALEHLAERAKHVFHVAHAVGH